MNTYYCPFTNDCCKGSDCRLFDAGCAFNRISSALLAIAENCASINTLCNSLSDIEVGISDIAGIIPYK